MDLALQPGGFKVHHKLSAQRLDGPPLRPRFAHHHVIPPASPDKDWTTLADAAQVNVFQDPASPDNPLLEEFYYLDDETGQPISNYQPNGHFRHSQRANVTFCDGHVEWVTQKKYLRSWFLGNDEKHAPIK